MTEGHVADEMRLFIPITKIDEEKRLVYGTVTEELMDKAGEVMDYETSKPFFEEWSSGIAKATEGKSVGNLRVMHTNKVAGKLTQIDYNDDEKRITCVAKVLDDDEWRMCLEGGYTGFSQGGRYVRRWETDGRKRYTGKPNEVSLVDNPMLPSAHFQVVKADGVVEEREFKQAEITKDEAEVTNTTDEHKDDVEVKEPEVVVEKVATDGMTEQEYLKRAAALGMEHAVETIGRRWSGNAAKT